MEESHGCSGERHRKYGVVEEVGSRVERRGCGLSVEAKWEWAGRSLRARRRPGGTCRSSLSRLGRDWPAGCRARPADYSTETVPASAVAAEAPADRLRIEPHPSPKTSHEHAAGVRRV
jgi:hypothetical protein